MFLIHPQKRRSLRLFFTSAALSMSFFLWILDPRSVGMLWWLWFMISSVGLLYAWNVDIYEATVVVSGPPNSRVLKGTRLESAYEGRVLVTMQNATLNESGEATLYCKFAESTNLTEMGDFTIKKAQ